MNKQLLEQAKKDGTVLALDRAQYVVARLEPEQRGCVPVVLVSIQQERGVYAGSNRKTVATCKLVPERQAEARQSDVWNGRHNPAPVETNDEGVVVRRRTKGEEEVVEILWFEGRDFLMPWDEYVGLRNAFIVEMEEKERQKAEAAATLDERYKNVERALEPFGVTFDRRNENRLTDNPETGGQKRVYTPMVSLTLAAAERLVKQVAAVEA